MDLQNININTELKMFVYDIEKALPILAQILFFEN